MPAVRAQLPGPVPGGQDDGGRPVGDRRQGVAPQGADHVVVAELLDRVVARHLGVRIVPGVAPAPGGHGGEVGLAVAFPASMRARACRAARATGSGHNGAM
jgi:hypothetical protein